MRSIAMRDAVDRIFLSVKWKENFLERLGRERSPPLAQRVGFGRASHGRHGNHRSGQG